MKFKIYAAKIEDMNQGWVWLGGHDKLDQRSIVKFSTGSTHKSVYCEVLKIDGNFINDYNRPGEGRIAISDQQSALVVSEWYRKKLGNLQTRTEVEINVEVANRVCGRLHACLDHPQVVVRLATMLGIWSVVLGVIAVILGAIAIVEPFFIK
ncbi:MAG: hypothetical protein ABSG80_05665 [Verrucomicrobiota bacterium]|jgi:hypothetical protein